MDIKECALLTPACTSFNTNFAPLKPIATILTVYLLLLSCFACVQEDECQVDEKQTATLMVADNEYSNDPEACTPFCVDKCCIGHVLFQPFFQLTFTQFSFRSLNEVDHKEMALSTLSHSIWQPPKAG